MSLICGRHHKLKTSSYV